MSSAVFAEYAPAGMNPWVYSTLYNGSYLRGELVVSAILTYLLIRRGILEAYRGRDERDDA